MSFSLGALFYGVCWAGNLCAFHEERIADISLHTGICCRGFVLSFHLKVMFMGYKIVQRALPMHQMNFVHMWSELAWQ